MSPGNPDHGGRASNLTAWWARRPSWDVGPNYILCALTQATHFQNSGSQQLARGGPVC